MPGTLSTERRDRVTLITADDGKANALSLGVLDELAAAVDGAEKDGAGAVVLCGRDGVFSGGFDLGVMRSADVGAIGELVTRGGEVISRLYASPVPVVAACTGHAIAAGALVLLGCHYRVGADGPFRIGLTEAALGLVLPEWATILAAERLSRRHVQQATIEGRVYQPREALDAGFLDAVAPVDALLERAMEEANRLAGLDGAAYAGNAALMRGAAGERLRACLARDRDALTLA